MPDKINYGFDYFRIFYFKEPTEYRPLKLVNYKPVIVSI